MGVIYDQGNDKMKVTGYSEVTPCTMNDIYTIDIASIPTASDKGAADDRKGRLLETGATDASDPQAITVNDDTVHLAGADGVLCWAFIQDNVASFGSGAPTIDFNGTDANGALAENSVALQDGTGDLSGWCYATSTKKFKTLTSIDVTDGVSVPNAKAVEVYQERWGCVNEVIQDAVYIVDSILKVGISGTAGFFQTTNEMIYFLNPYYFESNQDSTITLGELQGDWGINGSFVSLGGTDNAAPVNITTALDSVLKVYGSRLHNRVHQAHNINRDWLYLKNSTFSGVRYPSGNWRDQMTISSGLDGVELEDLIISNMEGMHLLAIPDVMDDVKLHYCAHNAWFQADGATGYNVSMTESGNDLIKLQTGGQAKSVVYLYNPTPSVDNIAATDVVFYDTGGPVHAETSIQVGITTDITVVDRDGTAINGASVILLRNDGAEVFNTTTGADGTITQQDVISRFWTGPSETLTDYSPFVLKVSMPGYEKYKQIFNAYTKVDWTITLDYVSNKVLGRSARRVHAGSFN